MAAQIKAILLLLVFGFVCKAFDFNFEVFDERDLRVAYDLLPVKNISIRNAGNLNFHIKVDKKSTTYQLLISSYQPNVNTKDRAYLWSGLKNLTTAKLVLLPPILYWPRDITPAPDDAFPFELAVTIPDGADVAGKGDGKVVLVDITDINFQKYFDLTSPKTPTKKTSIFSRVIWMDLGGIRTDYHFLTCRRIVSEGRNQLVLYRSPSLGEELTRPWIDIILKENACDGNIVLANIKQKKDDWQVVYTTGKVIKSLNFFWPETAKGNPGSWDAPEQIKGLVLEKDREYFDVLVGDMNKDGFLDVIVSVQGSGTDRNGTVEVWQIDPLNFREVSGYVRHVIAANFIPKVGAKDRSPGSLKLFYPDKESESGKPWVLVAGGDNGRAYYLQPKNNDKYKWDYTKVEINIESVAEQTVNGIEVGDVDGDGYAEVFVSLHNSGFVKVYTFRKTPPTTTSKPTTTKLTTTASTTKPTTTTTKPTTISTTKSPYTITTTTKLYTTAATSTKLYSTKASTTTSKPFSTAKKTIVHSELEDENWLMNKLFGPKENNEKDDATERYIRQLQRQRFEGRN